MTTDQKKTELRKSIANLKEYQGQLDMDGCMVAVSRQALDILIQAAERSEELQSVVIPVCEEKLQKQHVMLSEADNRIYREMALADRLAFCIKKMIDDPRNLGKIINGYTGLAEAVAKYERVRG